MKRIGLALSGGGFRATLYHIGVARLLHDAGLLGSISHVTSVSGGSIFAAHLALNWQRYTGSSDDFDDAAAELVRFVQIDVRNRIVRRYPMVVLANGARRLLGLGRDRKVGRTGLLERYYERELYGDTCLFDLPMTPQLHILATNLSEGALCSFSRDGLITQRRGAGHEVRFDRVHTGLATVAMAVTASSAFPGFFPPLDLQALDVGAAEGDFPRQTFTDGGVFDNLGVRMFRCITDSWVSHNDPLRPDDILDEEALLDAIRGARSGEAGPLRDIFHRLLPAPGSGTAADADGRASTQGERLVAGLWEILARTRLYREQGFERVQPDDPDARSLLDFVRSSGREPEWGDHLWLNRQLLAAVLREATGREILRPGTRVFDNVLVSDAGKRFRIRGRVGGLVGTAMRSSDILMDRVWQLEKESFQTAPGFTFLPLSQVVHRALDQHAPHPEIQRQVARIRTDLDRFTPLEISALVRHGYCVARAAIRADPHLATLSLPDGPPWDPLPADARGGARPPGGGGEAREARALQTSSNRRVVSSLWSWRDVASYAYVPFVLLLAAVPYGVYRMYEKINAGERVIEAISQSSPAYQTVLNLIRVGPPALEDSVRIEDVEERPTADFGDFDILSDTRIVDLREISGQPDPKQGTSRSAYFQFHWRVQKRSGGETNRYFRLALPVMAGRVAMRERNGNYQLRAQVWKRPSEELEDGAAPLVFGLSFDLEGQPVGRPIDIILEGIVPEEDVSRDYFADRMMRFRTLDDTDLITVWALLPERSPYSSFEVLVAPQATPERERRIEPTHKFVIEDGSIIGWQLAGAEGGLVYNSRWHTRN